MMREIVGEVRDVARGDVELERVAKHFREEDDLLSVVRTVGALAEVSQVPDVFRKMVGRASLAIRCVGGKKCKTE
jgi:hypothetical protein